MALTRICPHSTGVSLEEAQEIAIEKTQEFNEAEQLIRMMDGLGKVKERKGHNVLLIHANLLSSGRN